MSSLVKVKVVIMTNPHAGDERTTPLTVSMGARRATGYAPGRAGGHLPTVEEVSAGGVVITPAPRGFEVAIIARYNRGGRLEVVPAQGASGGCGDIRGGCCARGGGGDRHR